MPADDNDDERSIERSHSTNLIMVENLGQEKEFAAEYFLVAFKMGILELLPQIVLQKFTHSGQSLGHSWQSCSRSFKTLCARILWLNSRRHWLPKILPSLWLCDNKPFGVVIMNLKLNCRKNRINYKHCLAPLCSFFISKTISIEIYKFRHFRLSLKNRKWK